jgi:hypothetical protein
MRVRSFQPVQFGIFYTKITDVPDTSHRTAHFPEKYLCAEHARQVAALNRTLLCEWR